MFQLDRFVAADEHLDALSKQYLPVAGVIGVAVVEAPDTAEFNPGGPQFAVYVTDDTKVNELRRSGALPEKVQTRLETVEVVVINATFESHQAHTGDENPMRPGASISGPALDAGTLGARLDSPSSGDHFITAGHVVQDTGSDVFQAGRQDASDAGRNDRRVGEVVINTFLNGTSDAATVKLTSLFQVASEPHDTPAPSSTTPAIGLYRGSLRTRTGNTTRPFYIHINDVLAACGATLAHVTRMTPLDKGARVLASGRTSGKIESIIDGRMIFTGGSPVATEGFITDRVVGAAPGDSGAVCVIRRGVTTTWVDLSGQTSVVTSDVDDAAEYLPGTFQELDRFLEGDGNNIKVNGSTLDSLAGSNLISTIIAKLRRLGELEVRVTARPFQNPCKKEGRKRTRPTACREIILRPDREVEEPDEEIANEEIESEFTCCTFGVKPYVTITGDDEESTEISLSITATAAIRIKFSIKQRVMSGRFLRYGSCFLSICDAEVLRGTVDLLRTTSLEIEGSLGEIELPIIGRIKAGEGSFKRSTTNSITKSFVLPCSRPA